MIKKIQIYVDMYVIEDIVKTSSQNGKGTTIWFWGVGGLALFGNKYFDLENAGNK